MDQKVLQKIEDMHFTKSQARIADYIVKNPKRIAGMTAREAGKEIGVSDATVIRFARALGFEGYPQLQEQIQKELRENNDKIGRHSLYDRYVLQMKRYEEGHGHMKEVLRLMAMNLETSIRQNQEESYGRVASALLKADAKVIIGLRGGQAPAQQFSRLLSMITKNTMVITKDDQESLTSLMDLSEKDLAVFLNFPRYYKVDEKIAGILKKKGVRIVLITDSMASPVAKDAWEILLVETEHCGFFHSMLGVEAVLEYLMILMCWQQPEKFARRLGERDQILDEYLLK